MADDALPGQSHIDPLQEVGCRLPIHVTLQRKTDSRQFENILLGFGYFLYDTKQKSPQTYNKLTRFKDNDDRKLPLKYYLSSCCSFFEKRVKPLHKNYFRMSNGFTLLSREKLLCDFHLFPKKLDN